MSFHQFELYIATARDDINHTKQCLLATKKEIERAERGIEDLTIDACTLRVRRKELELDEEIVSKSENDAIMEKIIAQKRLAEVGGQESAVRNLQRALQEAKRELQATKGMYHILLHAMLLT